MGIQVEWEDTAHTIARMRFGRGWTWDDVRTALQRADEMIVSVPHQVNLVIDIRDAGRLPGDFMRVAGDLFAQGEARPNEGAKIVVGAGPLIRAAYGGLLKVYGGHMKDRPLQFADDMTQARAILQRES